MVSDTGFPLGPVSWVANQERQLVDVGSQSSVWNHVWVCCLAEVSSRHCKVCPHSQKGTRQRWLCTVQSPCLL